MSKGDVQRRVSAVLHGQDPPLIDWLVALSHDSPFERPPGRVPSDAGSGTEPPVPGEGRRPGNPPSGGDGPGGPRRGDSAGGSPNPGRPGAKQPFPPETTGSAPPRCGRSCAPARSRPQKLPRSSMPSTASWT